MITNLLLLPVLWASAPPRLYREELGIAACIASDHRQMENNLANADLSLPDGYTKEFSQSLAESAKSIRNAVGAARSAPDEEVDARARAVEEAVIRAKALQASIPPVRSGSLPLVIPKGTVHAPVLPVMTEAQRVASLQTLAATVDRCVEVLHYTTKASSEVLETNKELLGTFKRACTHCQELITSCATSRLLVLVREIAEHSDLSSRLADSVMAVVSKDPTYQSYRDTIEAEEADIRLKSASQLEQYLRVFDLPLTNELADTINLYISLATSELKTSERISQAARSALIELMHAISAVLVRHADAEEDESLPITGGMLDIVLEMGSTMLEMQSRIFEKATHIRVVDRGVAESLLVRAVKLIGAPGVRSSLDLFFINPDEESAAELEAVLVKAKPAVSLHRQRALDTVKLMEAARARVNSLMGLDAESHELAQELVRGIKAVVDATSRSDVTSLNAAIDHLTRVMAKPTPSRISESRVERAVNTALEIISSGSLNVEDASDLQSLLGIFMEEPTSESRLMGLEIMIGRARTAMISSPDRIASAMVTSHVTMVASALMQAQPSPPWAGEFAIFLSKSAHTVREVEAMMKLIGTSSASSAFESPSKRFKEDVYSLENINEKLDEVNEVLDSSEGRLSSKVETFMGRLVVWLHKAASGEDKEVTARVMSLIDKARPVFLIQRRTLGLPTLSSAKFVGKTFAEVVKEFMKLPENVSTVPFVEIFGDVAEARAMRLASLHAAISYAIEGQANTEAMRKELVDFREKLLRAYPYDKLGS